MLINGSTKNLDIKTNHLSCAGPIRLLHCYHYMAGDDYLAHRVIMHCDFQSQRAHWRLTSSFQSWLLCLTHTKRACWEVCCCCCSSWFNKTVDYRRSDLVRTLPYRRLLFPLVDEQMKEGRSPPTWEALALCLLISLSGRGKPLVAIKCHMARGRNCPSCSRERVCLFSSWRRSWFRYRASCTLTFPPATCLCLLMTQTSWQHDWNHLEIVSKYE